MYRRQYGNAICPRERIASTKTPTKDGKYRHLAWENLYFFVEVRPFEATSEYTGCIPWNCYVSDSCDSFAWFLPCWGRGLQGCWKRGVILDFAVQMAAAGHILACRWSQNAPTKLRIYFGLSLLLPWVLSWNRAGGGIAWFVNESKM